MLRPICLSAFFAALLAGQAQAVELFTNFHYGENVGFPSMNVPVSIYGGLGRGGWNCRAIDQIPVKSIPPEPAVTPTGCTPAHAMGCPNCGSAWNNYGQQSSARRMRWASNQSSATETAQAPVYQYDVEPAPSGPVSVELGVETESVEDFASPTPLEATPGQAPEEIETPREVSHPAESAEAAGRDDRWLKGEALFPQEGF